MVSRKHEIEQSSVWGNIGATARGFAEKATNTGGFEFVPGSLENATYLKSQGLPTGSTTTGLAPDATTQAQAQAVINDPASLEAGAPVEETGVVAGGKRMLANLFNAEDEADWAVGPVSLAPVETVWDGFLRGMSWGYNSISQLTSTGISALPGGIDTLSWDEAYNVSVGQVGFANAAIGLNDPNPVTGAIGFLSGGALNMAAAGYQEALGDGNALFEDPNFDINDPATRQAAFDDNTLNKWSTGLTDTVFTLAADPLIVGGKFMKMARLNYLDRPLTPENVAAIRGELAAGEALAAVGDVKAMAPVARILYDAITPDPVTGQRMTLREFEARGEVSFSSDSYGVAELITSLPDGDFAKGKMIFEAALGYHPAMAELKELHAQSYDTLMNARKQQIENRFLRQPHKQAKLLTDVMKEAEKKEANYKAIEKALAADPLSVNPLGAERALKEMNNALATYDSIANGLLPGDPLTEAAILWNKRVLNDAVKNNRWLGRAIDQANPIEHAFAKSDRGFATDTKLGRAVSARRGRAAKASYETKATVRQGWTSEDYFGNSRFAKTIRVWRKLGVENSTYYFNTTASGSSDGIKSFAAMMDGLRFYSRAPVPVTNAKGVTRMVGGVARKEELITKFTQAMGDEHNAQQALNVMEELIQADMIAAYGVDDGISAYIFKTMIAQRDSLKNVIIKHKYYPDKDTNGLSEILSNNAFLESQLLQGTYMIPFDEVEKVFRNVVSGRIKDPRATGLLTKTQGVTKKLNSAYEVFNDLWRPAVLFRLGYPQRNVSEGLFRSIMFSQSLAPLSNAVVAGAKGATNFGLAKRTAKLEAKVQAQIDVSDVARDTFDRAVADQAELLDQRNAYFTIQTTLAADIKKSGDPTQQYVDELTGQALNTEEVAALVKQLDADLLKATETIDNYGGRPVPAGMLGTKFQKWRDINVAAVDTEIRETSAFIDNQIEFAGGYDTMTVSQQASVFLLRDRIQQLRTQGITLQRDDVYALNQYTQQSGARRVVDTGGQVSTPSGRMINSAFGNPLYRDIALRQLSSDDTIKAIMTLKIDLQQSVFFKKVLEARVNVTIDNGEAYWVGMQDMLRQYSSSAIGKRILAGETDEKIGIWLATSDEGRVIQQSLVQMAEETDELTGDVSKILTPLFGDTVGEAIDWVGVVRQSLFKITLDNPAVLKIMRLRTVNAKELKAHLDTDEFRGRLNPVIGDINTLDGLDDVKEMFQKATAKAFEWIGTKPEDAFVRIPFYADRYNDAVAMMKANLLAQYPDANRIPVEAFGAIEVAAHRRALKDTKDFLYTIDRRTMLGRYGEYVSPFISATQNSVTALARLTRRDPALPGMMLALWNAPGKLGWEDQDGKLYFPIPKDIIPDGVEDFFGLDAMSGITVSKSGLNVIFPETGFGFVPRLSPIVQVASSELMKYGLFGAYPVNAPDLLVSAFGKHDADTVWNVWKEYMYGEDQGVSAETLSADKVLPPIANKFISLLRKDSSAAYGFQYSLQDRSEILLFNAGYRDKPAESAEIMERTNGQFILRMLGNAFAFTPPEYVPIVQPLIDMQKRYDDAYGMQGPMNFNKTFGPTLLPLGSTDTTKNVGGTTTTADTVRNIQKYDGMLRNVAPMVQSDPTTLGILVNSDDPEAAYDPSSLRWLSESRIPGLSRTWRELMSGPESIAESQRQAGWVEYTKFMGQLDALLEGAGLANYQLAAARKLNNMKKAFVDNMEHNPNYYAWSMDYKNAGSTKAISAVNVIIEGLKNEQFMKDHQGDLTWVQANNYIGARDEVIAAVQRSGKPLSNEANDGLRSEWDTLRQTLISNDVGWGNIANRYLTGDNNPDLIPVSFNQEVPSG